MTPAKDNRARTRPAIGRLVQREDELGGSFLCILDAQPVDPHKFTSTALHHLADAFLDFLVPGNET
jgi:hypothetical protein